MSRKVLVSYLDRNKVFSLPDRADMDICDAKYLRREFRAAFSFSYQNVNIEIIFQKYNKVWDKSIDIEEDAVLSDMDKLEAVVTPILGEERRPNPQESASNKEEDQVYIRLISTQLATYILYFYSRCDRLHNN